MAATNVQSSDATVTVTSPWSQVVRGGAGESEPVTVGGPASPSRLSVGSSVDESDNSGGGDVVKKHVWNRASNGVVEVVSPVMGAAWPALGESTKPTLKSSSSESLKGLSDGLIPSALQVVALLSVFAF